MKLKCTTIELARNVGVGARLNREKIPTISVKIYLIYVNSVIHRPNSLKVILHSLLQFLWHLGYEI